MQCSVNMNVMSFLPREMPHFVRKIYDTLAIVILYFKVKIDTFFREYYDILLIFLCFRFFQSLKDSDPLKTMFGHLLNKDINFIKVSVNLSLILASLLKRLFFSLEFYFITVYYINHRMIRKRVTRGFNAH